MADVTDTTYRTEGRDGYLAQIKMGNGASPEVFQAIANVTRIRPGGSTTEVIDVTHLRSPRAHREKIAGMRDSGPFGFDAIWVPSDESQSQAGGGGGSFTNGGMLALQVSRAEANFLIEFDVAQFGSPALQWGPFAGIVTEWTPGEIAPGLPLTVVGAITPLRDTSESLP
jgi:hypothetical protein